MNARALLHTFASFVKCSSFCCTILALSFLCIACEVHDYWMMPSALSVNSEEEIYYSELDEPLKDDLFMRYQLDYVIQNTSASNASEVVVIGTSYVNSFERATGLKVWHLEPDEYQDGILMSTQLQYGNELNVALACCNKSECNRHDVLCPEEEGDAANTANFCYNACKDRSACIEKCPATSACELYCKETSPTDMQNCMENNCTNAGTVNTCKQICNDDETCYESCTPYNGCINKCTSNAAACYKNCLSTWSQCTDAVFEPAESDIPCALCGGPEDEACKWNSAKDDDPILSSNAGNDYPCNVDCSAYPAACVTGCETLFDDDTQRMNCLELCLNQHLYWCNDFTVPTDYVDTNVSQPCCFSDFCQAEFQGIVKTFEVQCFNDASCSSNHYCSDEGICVASGSSSCHAASLKQTSLPINAFYMLLALATYCMIRRRSK